MPGVGGMEQPRYLGLLQVGAAVTVSVDESTTHIVAAGPQTEKVNWALRHGRHVVSPAWLQGSGRVPPH